MYIIWNLRESKIKLNTIDILLRKERKKEILNIIKRLFKKNIYIYILLLIKKDLILSYLILFYTI